MRADFAACVRYVDALAYTWEYTGVKATHDFLKPTRSGNTWRLPQPLAFYRVGNRPNTWRIALSRPPPAPATYHTSIMQSFVRTTDFGTGKTYPPTTRR